MRREWAEKYRSCTVEGCSEPRKVRGLCNRHYQAWYRENRPEQKRASDRRWRERVKTRRFYGVRTCPVCGRSFKPTAANQRYCPPTERDRERAKNSQPRSRCAKRAGNAQQRGWDPASRPLLEPFDCARCGKRCVPGVNVAAHATRFCSKAHKRAWHHEAARAAA